MKNIKEIEIKLQALQAGNGIPRYICLWADDSITQCDACGPVLDAASAQEVEEPKDVLVGYLTPQGQFFIAWDPEGSYVVETSWQYGSGVLRWVKGLINALVDAKCHQWNRVDDEWAVVRRKPSYPDLVVGEP